MDNSKTKWKDNPGKDVLQPDGNYRWEDIPLLSINDLGNSYFIYPEENGVVWIGGSEGIARYSPYIKKNYNLNYIRNDPECNRNICRLGFL